jgi:hypothetical protein
VRGSNRPIQRLSVARSEALRPKRVGPSEGRADKWEATILYNQPYGVSDPNASYVNGDPSIGRAGSIPPAASIEFDQREIVEVITRANARAYSDFSGAPCAAPDNGDLTQLRKAIEGFISSSQFLITTEVTFTVHGPGATFPDLITAFNYLGKFRITPTGHVILQLAGATSGSAVAYNYTQTVYINHPNNDRISIFGAQMLAPIPKTDAGYQWNGYSGTQRATDTAANLAGLRTMFATELHWSGPLGNPGCGFYITGLSPMHVDALLLTGDGSVQGGGIMFNCAGFLNHTPKSIAPGSATYAKAGLACVNWKGGPGFGFDVGSMMSVWSQEAADQNSETTFVALGNGSGIAISNGGFITASGNAICLSNDTVGFVVWPRGGTQWDGGIFCNANGDRGLAAFQSTGFIAGPLVGGSTTTPSHFYRNAQWGAWVLQANFQITGDFGTGATANGVGQIAAFNNSNVQISGPSANYSTVVTPVWNTVGNNEALISN